MLLIHPPVAKPSEPPAGIARLAGALSAHKIPCTLLDANLEGMLHLLRRTMPDEPPDTWTSRAMRNHDRNLAAVGSAATYRSPDRYKRAVIDLNRALEPQSSGIAGIANYQDPALSPLRSSDLLRSAQHPEQNPFYPYFSMRLRALVEKNHPSVVGMSLSYLSQALTAFAMIGFLRNTWPHLKIACGGGLMTSWMRRPGWNAPFSGLIDCCIEGPGEAALLGLAGIHETDKPHAPDYSSLPLYEYLAPGPVLPYSASSGCLWNRCSFCPEHAEDNRYMPIAAARAAEEVKQLVQQHHPLLIHFLDNALSPALMHALIAAPPGAPWYGFVRIGKDLADPDYVRALKTSGCVMLKLGIESGDQGVLDALSKGVDLATASAALRTLKNTGIATYAYLLFGTPVETRKEALKTLSFTEQHAHAITFLNLAIFNMPVGTPDAERYGTGSFYEGDLSLYTDFAHPAGWNRREVRRFLNEEFRRNPAIAAVVKNDPPFFTSNHAPFFCNR